MRNRKSKKWVVGTMVLMAACSPGASGGGPAAPAPEPSAEVLERAARADSVRRYYNEADVAFMTGMIHHHAQAVVMSRMAPTHGASPDLRTLAARIINAQKDEIALMQRWLRERDEPVPQVDEQGRVRMAGTEGHGGQGHEGHGGQVPVSGDAGDHMPMAGMLTAEQLARLDAAHGAEWDRLFLTYMIQHHKGALAMVDRLFATHGAAQGDAIFKIASDIGADQASEIDRMQRMLHELVFGTEPELQP